MRDGINHRVVLLAALFAMLVVLGIASRIAAHEPGDVAYLPDLNRYRLIEAYQRGGEAERAALEAELAPIPGAVENAVELGRDLDGDGDADEIHFHLEVVEIQEEVYPGEYVTFWVFAPLGGLRGRDHALQHPLPAAHDPPARDQPAQQHGRCPAYDSS